MNLPDPIPAILAAIEKADLETRAHRDREELLQDLGVNEATAKRWTKNGIPPKQRRRLDSLCFAYGVHWERPEHRLFRTGLLLLAACPTAIDAATTGLRENHLDLSIPEDRRALALSLISVLYAVWASIRPRFTGEEPAKPPKVLRGAWWAMPPESRILSFFKDVEIV